MPRLFALPAAVPILAGAAALGGCEATAPQTRAQRNRWAQVIDPGA